MYNIRNAYLSLYDYEKDSGRLGCYELDTGKFYLITKEEAERSQLEYLAEDMEDYLFRVFDKYEENPFTNIEGRPVQDKKKVGDFYESK